MRHWNMNTYPPNSAVIYDDDDIEYYETLESEHISTNQCSAYGVVPETDSDNTYEN